MASTFVNGPCHIFCGIDPILVSVLNIVPVGDQTVMVPSAQTDNYSTLTTGVEIDLGGDLGQFSGSTLNNNPQHPPPAILVQTLLRVGFLPVYLGTAEKSPTVEINRGWLPWYDDELGSTLPTDELYEGEEAWITADLSRWNESVYAFLAAVINRGPLGGARGMNFPSDIGTSMVYEGFAYPLILQFPYSGKPLYQLLGMPAGYRFFNATLAGPDRLDPLGSSPSKRRLLWRAREYLDLESQAMALYDNSAQVPGIN